MTYQSIDASRHAGEPFELYLFYRSGKSWAYTSSHRTITFDGTAYRPSVIQRDDFELSDESSSATVQVHLSRKLAVVPQFMAGMPPTPVWLRIYRGHEGDPEAEVVSLFHGQVTTFQRKGGEVRLGCASVQSAMEKRIPRMTVQQMCNHALYDPACGVRADEYAIDGEISHIAANSGRITIPQLVGKKDDYYTAGIVLFPASGDRAFIVRHLGASNQVELLNHPPGQVVVGAPVTVYAGCDRSVDTCRERFGNLANFMGFPFLPARNPFTQLEAGEESAVRYRPWQYPPL